MALGRLEVLGGGYNIVQLGGQSYVRSVAEAMNTDGATLLSDAAQRKLFSTTAEQAAAAQGWPLPGGRIRAQNANSPKQFAEFTPILQTLYAVSALILHNHSHSPHKHITIYPFLHLSPTLCTFSLSPSCISHPLFATFLILLPTSLFSLVFFLSL